MSTDNRITPPAIVSPSPASWLDTTPVQRYDWLRDSRPSASLTLGEALNTIVDGLYADWITQLRHLRETSWPETYREAKGRLPQFTFAGTFAPTRAKAYLQQHSGIVHADLDHLPDVQEIKLRLMQDPCTAYLFLSTGGDGLKYGVRMAPVDSNDAYQRAWQMVCDDHQARYGITWDPSGKDVCRLCFVSWDPACYINPDAELHPIPPLPPPAPAPITFSCPWPSPRLHTAAQTALARAVRLIADAPVGSSHTVRLKASYLIGGYQDSGDLDYDKACTRLTAAALANTDKAHEARRDITDGLKAGQARPITNPSRHADAWQSRARTPEETPAWRKC